MTRSSWLFAGFIGLFLAGMGGALHAQDASVSVNIESAPSGAQVYLDDAAGAPIGTTPMMRTSLARGQHVLIFRLPGYDEVRLNIEVDDEGETFRAVLEAQAAIVITAGDPSASGALVRIDGEPAGAVPLRKTVKAGRHLIQVGRRGYQTHSEWREISAGQVLNIPVVLKAKKASTGSIAVSADVPGVPIFVDGQQRGHTPATIDGLSVGEHLVEIRPTSAGQKTFQQIVKVSAGQSTTVQASVSIPVDVGSLRVITNVPSSVITVDGVDIGTAPASRDGLSVGDHVVAARAEGYAPVEQVVEVVAGRERVVSLRLSAAAANGGRIVVRANVPGARVWINGQDMGEVPVVANNVLPGSHSIVVRAEGYREARNSCEITPGRDCEYSAELSDIGTRVRVEGAAPQAELYIDEEYMGPLPWEGELGLGYHSFEVRAPGYVTRVDQIEIKSSKRVRVIELELQRASPDAQDYEEGGAEASAPIKVPITTHSAATLPTNIAVVDASIGWPYLMEARLSTGVLRWLDAGFAVRSFGRLTDFEARAKGAWHPMKQFSLGGQVRVGGGVGPSRRGGTSSRHKTNSVFFALEGIGTLHFTELGAFSIWVAMDVSSDRWDWSASDRHVVLPGVGRQKVVRGRLGGALEIATGDRWNIWMLVEGALGGKRRRIFGDLLGSGHTDSKIYGRLGFTYKFGSGLSGE